MPKLRPALRAQRALLLRELIELTKSHPLVLGGQTLNLFPRRSVRVVIKELAASEKPEEWRRTLAGEMLLYLERALAAGHPEAKDDALAWCSQQKLPVPDWVRDAPRIKRQGKASLHERKKAFYQDAVRALAVSLAQRWITHERKARTPRSLARSHDRYLRAGQVSKIDDQGSKKPMRGAYDRFTRERAAKYYLQPSDLMATFKTLAPTIFALLSR